MRRWLLIFIFSSLFSYSAISQTSGNGCLIGTVVYTQYLGTGYPYGPFSGLKKIYGSTGPTLSVNSNGYSATKPNNENYICGAINDYYSPVARHEITSTTYNDCVVEAYYGGPAIYSGATVTYTINNPTKCSSTPVPVENQARLWSFAMIIACTGAYIVRKRILLNIEV